MTAFDLATQRPGPYRPSRRAAWRPFFLLASATLAMALLAAAGMHVLFRHRLYVCGLVVVFAVMLLWGAVHLAVRLGKCRWPLLGALLGAAAAATMYLGFYHVGMIDDWGWGYSHRLDQLPRYIAFRQRVTIIRGTRLLPVVTPADLSEQDTTDTWANFVAEFATALGVLVLAGAWACRKPFCERCGQWTIAEMVAFHLDDARRIVRELRDRAAVLSPPEITGVPAERDYAAVTIEICPRREASACGGYVTVRQVRASRTWGKHLLRRAGLSPADLRALAPRFPTLFLGAGLAEGESPQGPGPSSPAPEKAGLEAQPRLADIWRVPESYAGRVLTRRHIYLNTLSTQSGLLAMLAGAILVLVGLALVWRGGAPQGSGPGDYRLWLVVLGVAMFLAGLAAQLFWPRLLGADLLPWIARRQLKKRPDRLVDPDDPRAIPVDVVDRKKLARVCLENAEDIGFLLVDEASRQLRFEGDRECWRIPGAAIVSCKVEELRVPPQSSQPTSFFACLLRVRVFEGQREILLAPRLRTGEALAKERRQAAALWLHGRLLRISRPAAERAPAARQEIKPEAAADALSVAFEPSLDDVAASLARGVESMVRQSSGQGRWTYRLLALVGICMIAVNVVSFADGRISLARMLVFNGIILAFAALLVLVPRLLRRLNSPEAIRRRLASLADDQRAEVLARRTVTIGADRLRVEIAGRVLEIDWRRVGKVERTAERLFIFDAPGSAIVVPRAAFGSDAAFERFAEEAKARALPAGESESPLQ